MTVKLIGLMLSLLLCGCFDLIEPTITKPFISVENKPLEAYLAEGFSFYNSKGKLILVKEQNGKLLIVDYFNTIQLDD